MLKMMATPMSSSGGKKRKHESGAQVQRQVAQKLQHCADVTDAFVPIQRALSQQLQRYQTFKARAEEISQLNASLEQLTHFQTLFGAEMDTESFALSQVTNLGQQTDKLLGKLSNSKKKRTESTRTQKVVDTLPQLVEKATSIISERRKWIAEMEQLPSRHQWVPVVLWRLYDDVVECARRDGDMKSMKKEMHFMMKTLKELNPFFYLQVLYQPPPQHLHGTWEIKASDKLTAITETMFPFFRYLKARSVALRNKRDSSLRIRCGWNQLRITLLFVKRAARHFHFLVLYLYSVAMGCESPNVHAGIISEKAMSGMLRDDAELRSQLRLCRDSAMAEDSLVKETYEWAPELLVYIDEWRRHPEHRRIRCGFSRREQLGNYLPQFPSKNGPKGSGRVSSYDVLADIGCRLRDTQRLWLASRLGTADFKSMSIADIGVLETKIKGSLGAVIRIVYNMMLARWMSRKNRSSEWWASLELRERVQCNPEKGIRPAVPLDVLQGCTENSINDQTEDVQDATDVESVEPKECPRIKMYLRASGNFRRPTNVKMCDVLASAKEKSRSCLTVVPQPLKLGSTIRLRDIYEWNDGDISVFQRDTQRIKDVRRAMVALRGRLEWAKVSPEALKTTPNSASGQYIGTDWRVVSTASEMCALTSQAVAFAEEAAMHDAAEALTKKPSLRVAMDKISREGSNDNKSVSSEDSVGATTTDLRDSITTGRQHITGQFDPYEGERSSEWCDFILATGHLTTELLRNISHDAVFAK
ncbi:hypothetical protein P3T76_005470 [Phytophthora citrophthora]|uniref:Uncharacterized protein n=1 Tax=Phytophthora citrophthora TaxID=4793 RepID=A0AAD9LMN2_9STRA|nr:hypothetical protein P3T76_005470 [Phytophthora citrophthora]